MGIGRFAFTPILPLMQVDGSIDLVRGGWLASANYAGYLAGGLSAIAWRWSAASAIRLGLAAVALSTLGMALPLGVPSWLVLRAVAGVASAWVLVFATAAVLTRLDQAPALERGSLAGMHFSGVGVGIVVAGLLTALVVRAEDPARASWIATGGVAAVFAVMLRGRFDAGPRAPQVASPVPRLPPQALALAACYAAFGFGYIIPATFLSAMAREATAGGALYVLTWPLFGAAAAASTWLVQRMGSSVQPRVVWAAGQGVMAVGVAVPALAPGIAAVVASGLLVGGTFMVVTMAGMQEARRISGAAAARMLGVMTSSFAVGQIAGPLLVSALAAHGVGYAAALEVAAAALVASALFLCFLPERGSR
jgi:MFS family permease